MFRLVCGAMITFVITSVQATVRNLRIPPNKDTFSVTINEEVIEVG